MCRPSLGRFRGSIPLFSLRGDDEDPSDRHHNIECPRAGTHRPRVSRRRSRGLRRGRPLDRDPRRHRREQLHALRVPRADRAPRGALPVARRLPCQRPRARVRAGRRKELPLHTVTPLESLVCVLHASAYRRCTMHRFSAIATALAVGVLWSFGPAFAAGTTEKPADSTTDKVESTKDTIKDKAEHVKDTIKDKAVRTKDTIKEKFAHAKDKMRSKTERADDRVAMADTRAAQEALKTQGFEPGPIDGRMGPRTRAALNDYQRKNDLPV